MSGPAPGGGPAERPLRADARKNRQRILDAAAEAFAAHGLAVPIDLVAERAGVGVGTLYRHFPTKEALFEAIVASKMAELVDTARAAGDEADPVAALFGFLQIVATELARKQDLLDALSQAGIEVPCGFTPLLRELEQGIDRLLASAVRCGAVHPEVAGRDVLGLIIGTSHAARAIGGGGETARRLVAILCRGLQTPGGA